MSLHTIRQFPFRPVATLTAALVAMAMSAAQPAMAQVPGVVGSAACTGVGQKSASLVTGRAHEVTTTVATFNLPGLSGSYFEALAGGVYPYTLHFSTRKADGTGSIKSFTVKEFTSVSSAATSRAYTFNNLVAGTNYVLYAHADANAALGFNTPANAKTGIRVCFKTGPSAAQMSRSLRWYNDIKQIAGGCFAFGGTPAQVRACLCGARNASGRWAPNDDDDGYEWQISAAERTRLGCTTN